MGEPQLNSIDPKVAKMLQTYANANFQSRLAIWRLQLRLVLWALHIQGMRKLKRLLDLSILTLALPIVLPVGLLTVLAIRLESPGPAIFRQTRVGKWGQLFTCYKFRSMYMDAEERKQELMAVNEADGPVFKMHNDPRVTRVGRIIRKLSIDELPQLINIWKGDMTFVGPRPPLPNEVSEYEFEQRRRLDVVPGLTGLQQVSGRSDLSFERWVELDLEYINKQNLWNDIVILLKTVPTVIFGRGAY
ncbi:MAG: sugar transferase [Caldilineaceae bacterium]|nr:sugar transferase [Caldilineaceae bacterium]